MVALNFNLLEHSSNPSNTPKATHSLFQPAPPGTVWPADCKLSQEERDSWLMNSTYLGPLDSVEKIIRHWEIVHADRDRVKAANVVKADPAIKQAEKALQAQRQGVVDAANAEWREAVRIRKENEIKWSAHLEQLYAQRKAHLAGLDAIVEQKRNAYRVLRDAS